MTCPWSYKRTWMSHVSHMNEFRIWMGNACDCSFHIHEWVMSHTQSGRDGSRYVTWLIHLCVMSHMNESHMNVRFTHMNESCHICKPVAKSQVMWRVSFIYVSCHIHESYVICDMTHSFMCHNEWDTSHNLTLRVSYVTCLIHLCVISYVTWLIHWSVMSHTRVRRWLRTNEPCHIHKYEWVMPHTRIWKSHVTDSLPSNDSFHKEWVMSHVWIGTPWGVVSTRYTYNVGLVTRMSHVIYVNESCHTCEWVLREESSRRDTHLQCVTKSRHIWEWVTSYMWMSHVTYVNASCHVCECMRMSHVIYVTESCHVCECVMSHIWMSHVTLMNESCYICRWVMSHTNK